MFKFTKKIAIVASLVALYSGEYAIGSVGNSVTGHEVDDYNNRLVNAVPNDVWKKIFANVSEDSDPKHLAPVCKMFNDVMLDIRGIPQDPNNPGANDFKQLCMKIHEANEGPRRFKNGILRYTPKKGRKVIELKFSELANPYCGTFDLSKCGDMSKYIRITTSVEEFFKVRGENEGKLVVLTCPFHVIEQAIQSNPDHPFSKLLLSWDKSKAPIGMFWRSGNWTNSAWFDYLVSVGLGDLSEKSIYENWRKTACRLWRDGAFPVPPCCGGGGWSEIASCVFVLIFDKPKLGVKDKSPRKKPRV